MSRISTLSGGMRLASARPFPERSEEEAQWHDRVAEFLVRATVHPFSARLANRRQRLASICTRVDRHGMALRDLGDDALRQRARSLRSRLRREGFAQELVGECFAIVREVATRAVGQTHYPEQLMAGYSLLQGKLVEMATGEGKTMAATLPACAVALAGFPVHVITVNDYLAARDAQTMGPIYTFLDLGVGAVVEGMERAARRAAYAQAVTYCTNKELAFDYLRDRVLLQRRSSNLHLALERLSSPGSSTDKLVLRGLYYAVVDEADSVFIDEARTPLILSATTRCVEESKDCADALKMARALQIGEHYQVDRFRRAVTLTEKGKEKIEHLAATMAGIWTSVRARDELVRQALSALLLYHRDQHYVVADSKVKIVDESTGRILADRSWERGLHQLIEAKEGCELTHRRETLARMTYQRLFRRYVRLAGMTGTASEVAREIDAVYRLPVVRIPLHKPSRRRHLPPVVCLTREEKWRRVADAAADLALGKGRPVLIGTRSVKASEEVSALLSSRGIEHALLNAKQDQAEAEVIARAGAAGRVTVATNMAGRGTDIRLGSGVAEAGGLHVILTEYHESRRIDRQLFGRCARQGDPGTCQAIVSLEDEIFVDCAPAGTRLLGALAKRGIHSPGTTLRVLRALAQRAAEKRNASVRMQNLKLDRRLNQMLAFSGRSE